MALPALKQKIDYDQDADIIYPVRDLFIFLLVNHPHYIHTDLKLKFKKLLLNPRTSPVNIGSRIESFPTYFQLMTLILYFGGRVSTLADILGISLTTVSRHKSFLVERLSTIISYGDDSLSSLQSISSRFEIDQASINYLCMLLYNRVSLGLEVNIQEVVNLWSEEFILKQGIES